MITVKQIEKAIGLTAFEWAGNCYAVAKAVLDTNVVLEGTLRYGHYLGDVHPLSRFWDITCAAGFVRHGWIERPDGSIVDPTRWVFECVSPYVYVGINDCYDAGGNIFRMVSQKPAPNWRRKKGERINLDLPWTAKCFVHALLKDYSGSYSHEQGRWLANLSLYTLSPFAKEIFTALKDVGMIACIPIDNQDIVFGKNERKLIKSQQLCQNSTKEKKKS
jgi:hypothetical protein